MSLENPEALWEGKTLIPTSDISKRHEKLIQEALAQIEAQQLSVEPLKENTVMKNQTKGAV